jgi:hypothetical protein
MAEETSEYVSVQQEHVSPVSKKKKRMQYTDENTFFGLFPRVPWIDMFNDHVWSKALVTITLVYIFSEVCPHPIFYTYC